MGGFGGRAGARGWARGKRARVVTRAATGTRENKTNQDFERTVGTGGEARARAPAERASARHDGARRGGDPDGKPRACLRKGVEGAWRVSDASSDAPFPRARKKADHQTSGSASRPERARRARLDARRSRETTRAQSSGLLARRRARDAARRRPGCARHARSRGSFPSAANDSNAPRRSSRPRRESRGFRRRRETCCRECGVAVCL